MATRVFYDGFESYAAGVIDVVPNTPWFKDSGRGTNASVVTSAADGLAGAYAGSKMLRTNWLNDGSLVHDGVGLEDWDYTSEMLVRLRLRYDQNVQTNPALFAKVFRLWKNADNSFYAGEDGGYHSYWEVINNESPPNGGPIADYQADGASLLEDGSGTWHKLEVYILHNTIGQDNGTLKIWLDDTLLYNKGSIQTVTDSGNWFSMYLMSNWNTQPGDSLNYVYWDEIEIFSDSSAGTACTGSMSDASIEATGGGAAVAVKAERIMSFGGSRRRVLFR